METPGFGRVIEQIAMGMIYVLPDTMYSSQEVEKILGKDWTCPLCKAETTRNLGGNYPSWVNSPLCTHEPKFICEGCATDIHVTCANDEYEISSYKDLVEEFATQQNIPPLILRKMCLEHQIEILEGRLRRPCHPKMESECILFRKYLKELLQNLDSSEHGVDINQDQ